MKFKKEDILNIAELAKLDLSQAELTSYGEQLSSITGYIENLQSVPEAKTAPTNQGLANVFREDRAEPWEIDESEAALSQADREVGLVKVRRVL